MKEFKQLYLHRPENRLIGDCHRTAIACIMDVEPMFVPHGYGLVWNYDNPDDPETCTRAEAIINGWLSQFGLRHISTPLQCDLRQLREYIFHYYRGLHVTVGCTSHNGTGHTVVMRDRDYMWDPAIDNSGCAGPMPDGHYWLGTLVAIR